MSALWNRLYVWWWRRRHPISGGPPVPSHPGGWTAADLSRGRRDLAFTMHIPDDAAQIEERWRQAEGEGEQP